MCFQEFVDLCCRAFNILRNNSHVLFNLMGVLVNSNIPGLTVGLGTSACVL